VAEIRLDHRLAGSGEPLLVIHGIGSTWRAWKPVLEQLEARHEVLSIDLPGFGYSEPLPPGTTPTMGALSDAVERALDAVGWDRPHVAGNSLGGWAALELARRGRAESVVAISPLGMSTEKERRFTSAHFRLLRAVATVIVPHAELVTRSAFGRTLVFSSVSSRPWLADPADAAEALRLFAGAPAFQATFDAVTHDRPRDLGEIGCPVRIVWGSRDMVLLPRQGDRFVREIPNAELVRLPGLGHVPMGDDPDAVAESILQFTARHARKRTAV
jgi:pimeloyl-ACP methyl ester carboxylesterase